MQLLIDNVNTHNHSIIVIKDTFNEFSDKFLYIMTQNGIVNSFLITKRILIMKVILKNIYPAN